MILASQWYSFFTLFSFRYVVCWQDTVRESFRAKFCVSLVWPVLLHGSDVILANQWYSFFTLFSFRLSTADHIEE